MHLLTRAISLAAGLSGCGALLCLYISMRGTMMWLNWAMRDGMGLSTDCLPLLL